MLPTFLVTPSILHCRQELLSMLAVWLLRPSLISTTVSNPFVSNAITHSSRGISKLVITLELHSHHFKSEGQNAQTDTDNSELNGDCVRVLSMMLLRAVCSRILELVRAQLTSTLSMSQVPSRRFVSWTLWPLCFEIDVQPILCSTWPHYKLPAEIETRPFVVMLPSTSWTWRDPRSIGPGTLDVWLPIEWVVQTCRNMDSMSLSPSSVGDSRAVSYSSINLASLEMCWTQEVTM